MFYSLLLLLLAPLMALTANCTDKHEGSTENTLPSGRIVLPYAFDDSSAASLILQGGNNNFRANATVGAFLTDQQRLKASYDFMEERLNFKFCTGKEKKWVTQQAAGLKYEYLFDDCTFKTLSIGGFFSHAPGKTLHSKNLNLNETLSRRIVGSNYWNVDLGLTVTPWENGYIGLILNYGRLTYNYKYHSRDKINGLGGKVTFDQYFWDSYRFHAAGEWTRFSRFVEGKLSKTFCFECGALDLGLFGSRLVGEHGLADNTRFGIELTLGAQGVGTSESYYSYDPCQCRTPCDLIAWIAEAAVEMPAIYVVTEQKLSCNGAPVALVSSVTLNTNEIPSTFDMAGYFSGTGLIYSIVGTPVNATATIDPTSGVLTITDQGGEASLVIQAANRCGSAQISVTVTQPG